MAFKIKRTSREVEEIPLASTADIAFLLIVFFLAASALLELRGVVVPLPKKDAPPMQVLKKNLFRINIKSGGEYEHDGKQLELSALGEQMVQAFAGNPELIVAVKVSAQAPVEKIPQLVLVVQKAKINKLSIGME